MNGMISFSEQCQKRVSEMVEVSGQETKGGANKNTRSSDGYRTVLYKLDAVRRFGKPQDKMTI